MIDPTKISEKQYIPYFFKNEVHEAYALRKMISKYLCTVSITYVQRTKKKQISNEWDVYSIVLVSTVVFVGSYVRISPIQLESAVERFP